MTAKLNKTALIKNVNMIKIHAKQIKYMKDQESARQKLDRLFKQEGRVKNDY